MRNTSPSASTVVNLPWPRRSFDRRPLASLAGHVTVLMLFKHEETDTQIQVSEDDDAARAVWISKALLTIDRSRDRFLVVTISQRIADRLRFSSPLIDRARYAPHERKLLEEAITVAQRERRRFNGYHDPLPYPGRNAFA